MNTEPKFYYKFFARVKRCLPDNQLEYIVSEKIFRHEKLIVARQHAFEYYQNYIEVLLQSLGKDYVNDEQARIDLEPLLGSLYISLVLDGSHDQDGYFHWDKLDYTPIRTNDEGSLWGEYAIHSIPIESLDALMINLQIEEYYYEHFGYATGGLIVDINFYGNSFKEYEVYPYPWANGRVEARKILQTPFSWSRFDEPIFEPESITDRQIGHWTGFNVYEEESVEENDKRAEMPSVSESSSPYFRKAKGLLNELKVEEVNRLILAGEGPNIEFKPSLHFNYKTGRPGISVKNIIAKAMCAFLNTNGGTLIIGVTDNGTIQGLKDDYSQAPEGKIPRDYLQLEFDKLLWNFFPKYVVHFLNASIITINNEDLFVIQIWPSNQPIFIKGKEDYEFCIRTQASSIELRDKKELVEYCLSKWGSRGDYTQ